MKRTPLILPIILFLTLMTESLFAQSADRFDRDIRIAEGIIEQLFEADRSSEPFRSRHIREITGQYIPGYGIHFRIAANLTPAIVRVVLENQTEIQIDADPDDEELREMGREYVEQRLMEYLKNYAPLFKNLPADEVIRLTVAPNSSAVGLFIARPGMTEMRQNVANITVWAMISDIRAYDTNSISEQEFDNRIEVVDLADQETERDQTVFASILQTSLQEISDTIRVRRSPVAEYLPGLGLSYTLNASLRSGRWFDFGDLDIQIEELKIESDSLSIDFSNMLDEIDFDELGRIAERIDSVFAPGAPRISSDSMRSSLGELRRTVEQQRNTLSEENVRTLVDQFHNALKQTVEDYGPTLRSLKDDEMLIISVNWSGRHSSLPRRTELRILISDLKNGKEPELTTINRR